MKLPIDWSKIPSEFNYAAMDADGRIYAYNSLPLSSWDSWDNGEDGELISYAENWRDSLTERPTDDWIPWNGGNCPVDGYKIIEVEFRSGEKVERLAKDVSWGNINSFRLGDIIAYRVKEINVEQAKQEPANKPHPQSELMKQWLENPERKLQWKGTNEWITVDAGALIKLPNGEFRFADEAKQECVSPLTNEEMRSILGWTAGYDITKDIRRLGDECHRAALKWVSELPAVTSLSDDQLRHLNMTHIGTANAAIAEFQAQLKRMAGE